MRFGEEIKCILATNGDKLEPLNTTIAMVENIVLEETILIIKKMCLVNKLRTESNILGIEDIIITLDQNHIQLQKLFAWLQTRTFSYKHINSIPENLENTDEPYINSLSDSNSGKIFSKHQRLYDHAYKFLTSNVYTNEKESIKIINCKNFDLYNNERKRRLDIISEKLALNDYLKLQEMKAFGFFKNKVKLREWIESTKVLENLESYSNRYYNETNFNYILGYLMKDSVLEIFAYLCKEIILCLLDQVYILYYYRQNHDIKKSDSTEPCRKVVVSIIDQTLKDGITPKDIKEAYRRFHFHCMKPSTIIRENKLCSAFVTDTRNTTRKILLINN